MFGLLVVLVFTRFVHELNLRLDATSTVILLVRVTKLLSYGRTEFRTQIGYLLRGFDISFLLMFSI